jgi:hypothetical protein
VSGKRTFASTTTMKGAGTIQRAPETTSSRRLSVWLRDRRERSREAVVARDEMNDEVPVEIARGRKVPKFRRG